MANLIELIKSNKSSKSNNKRETEESRDEAKKLAQLCGIGDIYFTDSELIKVSYRYGGKFMEKAISREKYETLIRLYGEPEQSLFLTEVIASL